MRIPPTVPLQRGGSPGDASGVGGDTAPPPRAQQPLQHQVDVPLDRRVGPGRGGETRSRWRASRDSAGAVLGGLLGAVPHVLHHVGLIAGAALLTGAAGNVALFVLGLLFSIPLLRRLYRRFRSWAAPALAVAGFAAMFTFSAVVLGPLITGSETAPAPVSTSPVPASPSLSSPAATDHGAHHSG